MAIYRPSRRRWPAAAAAGAVGLAAGLAIGIAVRPPPDPAVVVGEVRSELVGAASVLEVVTVEYSESVEGGRVLSAPEYDGARDALERSRRLYEGVRVAAFAAAPSDARAIDAAYDDLAAMINDLAEPREVADAAEGLAVLLESVFGGG